MKLNFIIPFFGAKSIELHNESEFCYNILNGKKEIDRLEKHISHLGIIHEVKSIPSFGRWTLIELMMTLISETMDVSKKLELGTSKVRLKKYEFSSPRELLLSLSMFYSIGHLVGTFTSEHALLSSIVKTNKKDKFCSILEKKISSYGSIRPLNQTIRSIINNENVFELFKIFTLLKTFQYFNKSPKYQELVKLYIGYGEYISSITNSEQ